MSEFIKEGVNANTSRKSSGAHSEATVERRFERRDIELEFEEKLLSISSKSQIQLEQGPQLGSDLQQSFVCSVCQRVFIQNSNLKRHMLVHSGEKPFACKVCGKDFTTASNLKMHNEIHSEKDARNKHGCEKCGKKFLYKCSLVKHCKKNHLVASKKDDSGLENTRKLVKKENDGKPEATDSTPTTEQALSNPIVLNNDRNNSSLYQALLLNQLLASQYLNHSLLMYNLNLSTQNIPQLALPSGSDNMSNLLGLYPSLNNIKF